MNGLGVSFFFFLNFFFFSCRYKKLFSYENQTQEIPKTRGTKKISSLVSSAKISEEKKRREEIRRREAVGGVLHFLGWVEKEILPVQGEDIQKANENT